METNNSIVSNLLEIHLGQAKRTTVRALIITAIPAVICLPPLIYFFAQFPNQPWNIGSIVTLIVFGACCLTLFLMSILMPCLIIQIRRLKKRSHISPSIIWKLNEDQWKQYLEHMYGEVHPGYTIHDGCSPGLWCCRRSDFARYAQRDHGYIVILPYCVIIDELYILDFRVKLSGQTRWISIQPQQKVIRIGAWRSDGDGGTVEGHVDLFVPHAFSEPQDPLERLVQFFNRTQGKNLESFTDSNLRQITGLFSNQQ